MHITVLHNNDHEFLEDDPGPEARADVVQVAHALCHALTEGTVSAEPVAIGEDPLQFAVQLQARRPNLVVNLCESIAGESRGEMMVPALLDVLGIPYTGSGALALGLALHKDKAKELLIARHVPTPRALLVSHPEMLLESELPFPLMVKPAREDASVGITEDSVVFDAQSLTRAVKRVLNRLKQPALVEQYIDGREVYVPLLGNAPRQPLALSEIAFGKAFERKPRIVTYKAKWDVTSAECVDSPSVPCHLDSVTTARVVKTAIAAFEALGCQDYGRVDLRLSAQGEPYVIDINPNCDLHPEAGFAKAAKATGLDYRALASRLVEIAFDRSHGNSPNRAAGQNSPLRTGQPHRDVLGRGGGLRARAHRARAHAE